jgi:predicted membrane-bound spermidine synthase
MTYKPLHIMERAGLYLTVFLTGAAVMVIELLGTQLIAPFYGVSLYVWSSLISVTMIALALDYFASDYWADRVRRNIGRDEEAVLGCLQALLRVPAA